VSIGVGTCLAGKYTLIEEIGQGGMGVVFRAHHKDLDTDVAVKVLGVSSATHRKALFREARRTFRIKSPHVVQVLDVGEENGHAFIVMELVRGPTLGSLLPEGSAFSVAECIDYALQLCDALAAAHAEGIVHRDLKPGNVMHTRGRDGTPCLKVLDFGIAVADDDLEQENSQSASMVAGTPMYMSPEQFVSSKGLTERSDLWSLGVCLYRMASGSYPYLGKNMTEVAQAILREKPPALSEVNPTIPRYFSDVVAKCLDRNPQARWPDAKSVAGALKAGPGGASNDASETPKLGHGLRVLGPTEVAPARRPSHFETIVTPMDEAPTLALDRSDRTHMPVEADIHVSAARPRFWTRTKVATTAFALLALSTAGAMALKSTSLHTEDQSRVGAKLDPAGHEATQPLDTASAVPSVAVPSVSSAAIAASPTSSASTSAPPHQRSGPINKMAKPPTKPATFPSTGFWNK
jgi:serine/threonine protein kinase